MQMQSRPRRSLFCSRHISRNNKTCTCFISFYIAITTIASAWVSTCIATACIQWTVSSQGDSRRSTQGSPLCQPYISRVRFRGYSDLEICRIAGDIALIHHISTSGPNSFARSFSPRHQPIEHIQRLESARSISSTRRYSLERSSLDGNDSQFSFKTKPFVFL